MFYGMKKTNGHRLHFSGISMNQQLIEILAYVVGYDDADQMYKCAVSGTIGRFSEPNEVAHADACLRSITLHCNTATGNTTYGPTNDRKIANTIHTSSTSMLSFRL